MSNRNVTKIERLSSGMVKLYNRSNVIGAFSALNSISIGYENNNARTIQFTDNGNTISFQLFNLQEIVGSVNTVTFDPIDVTSTGPDYNSRVFEVFDFLSSQVFQGFSPGPTYVGGVVAAYPNFASFPVTGTESVIYIDEATNSAYYWDGTSYQLLVSTGVEEFANFASFPVTGSANVIYVDMSVPEPYVWNGTAYDSLTDSATVSWGSITGTLSAQTDLQAALNAKVPTTRFLTINGIGYDLSADRAWTIATGLTVGTTPIASGAVGRILFEGTGNVLQESSNLFWDNTNGRLGLNTASPSSTLHLVGTGTTSATKTFISQNSSGYENATIYDNGTWFLGSANHKLEATPGQFDFNSPYGTIATIGHWGMLFTPLAYGSSTSFEISTNFRFLNANVLIGTSTDAGYKLDVNGTARVQETLTAGQNTGYSYNHLFDAGLGGITFRRLDSYVTPNFITVTQPNYATAANGSMIYVTVPGNEKASGFADLKLTGPYKGGGSTFLQVGTPASIDTSHTSLAKFHTGDLNIGPDYGGAITYMGLDIKLQGRTADYSVSTDTNFAGIYIQSSFNNAYSITTLPIGSWKTFVDKTTLSNLVTPFTSIDIAPTFTDASNAVTSYGININPTLNTYTGFVALNILQGKSIFGGTGNVLIGTSTDNGAKFQIKSLGSTSATNAISIQNSSSTELFKIDSDGNITALHNNAGFSINATSLGNAGTISIGTINAKANAGSAQGNLCIGAGSSTVDASGGATVLGNIGYAVTSSIAIGAYSRANSINTFVAGGWRDDEATGLAINDVYFGNGMPSVTAYGGGPGIDGTPYTIWGAGAKGSYIYGTGNKNGGNITIHGGLATGNGTNGDVIFGTGITGASGTTIATGATRVVIKNNSGNVLIGTTTDAGFKLDVNGAARVAGGITILYESALRQEGITAFFTSSLGIFKFNAHGVSLETAYMNGWNREGFFNFSVNIGTNSTANVSAVLEATSTTQGFLPPRMTTTQKSAISSPATGLVVYDNVLNKLQYYNGTTWTDGGGGGSSSLTVGTTPISSGAAGRILFEGAGNILQESSNLFWDETNGRLGIGTTSPSSALQVNGDYFAYGNAEYYGTYPTIHLRPLGWATGTNPSFYLFAGTDADGVSAGDYTTFLNAADTSKGFVFRQHTSSRLVIAPTTGNILIGTTIDEGFRLDVNGNIRATTLNGAGLSSLVAQSHVASGSALIVRYSSNQNAEDSARSVVLVEGTFNPANGAATFAGISLSNTINQTGGSTGISRGVYVNPTLTSAVDFRAIETTNGKVIFGGTGNVLIGTTTDAGYKLDVNGGAIIRSGLQVNSVLTVNTIYPLQNQNIEISAAWADSSAVTISAITNKAQVLIVNPTANLTLATGTHDTQRITHTFAPTSGTAVVNALTLNQTINQTGGANGITRGLYVNPTLTAATDFRAIETTTGNVLFGASGTGFYWDNTNSRLGVRNSTPTASLHIVGSGNTSATKSFISQNSDGQINATIYDEGYWFFGLPNNRLISNPGQFDFNSPGGTMASIGQYSVFFTPGASGTASLFIGANFQLSGANVLIGTSTDAGYKLDVNGTLRVSGITTLNSTLIVPQIQCSTRILSQDIVFSYWDDGVYWGGSQGTLLLSNSVGTFTTIKLGGTTSSFPALKISGSALAITDATGTFNTNLLVGTTTDVASSKLTVDSTTQGFLPPRMTTTQKNAISSPATGLVVYDSTLNALNFYNGTAWTSGGGSGTVTSVGLTMPSAFTVTSSPVTTSGTLAVTGAGTVSQYVRGDGSLANFPSSTGGGSSLAFYLNGSVAQGTFGGVAMKEMDRTPILGAGTDFTISADGYIQSFITDANVPNLLEIPAGNWNFETYFSVSSDGGSPSFYVELYKWDGATLSLIASNSATPESITNGTTIDAYFSALAVPQTTLAATDRLAIRIYVTHSGRTITLHTENSHLCEVITTFSTGLTALNGLTVQVQNFATGTTGTDFGISSATSTHTFNLPTASATNRGALSSADWSTFNGKQDALTLTTTGTSGAATLIGATLNIPQYTGTNIYNTDGSLTAARTLTLSSNPLTIAGTSSSRFFANGNVGIGTTTDAGFKLDVNGGARLNGTLNLALDNNPAVPATDTLTIFDMKIGGRNMLAIVGPAGVDNVLQTHIARNGVSWWSAAGNSTTIIATGNQALTNTGTATAANIAVTNVQTRMKRLEYLVTTAAATAVAGFRAAANQWWMGNAADSGGFHFICRFGPATGVATTSSRMFVGMTTATNAPTDVNPSTLTNFFGVGYDSTDTNLQFFNNAASTTTRADLGASFPVPTTDRSIMYELAMFVAPNSTTLYYTVTNLGSGATASGTITSNLPTANTLMSPRGWCSAGGTSSVIGIALSSLYLETDY